MQIKSTEPASKAFATRTMPSVRNSKYASWNHDWRFVSNWIITSDYVLAITEEQLVDVAQVLDNCSADVEEDYISER